MPEPRPPRNPAPKKPVARKRPAPQPVADDAVRAPRKRWLQRLVKLTFVGLLFSVIGLGVLLWYASTVPLPPEALPEGTSVVLAADGKTRIASFDGGEDRTLVRLDQVSPDMENAVLAAEDRYFYSHGGVQPLSVVRALVTDLRSKSAKQGGSTITQQYVKNVYVGRDRTAKRSFREAILSVKLEQKLSKAEILERYLNTIYFGRGAYGVQAASRAWFDKDAKDLGPKEATYLAALIRSPEGTRVDRFPDVAERRRESVIVQMLKIGSLDETQANEVRSIPISTYVIAKEDRQPAVARSEIGMEYVADMVKRVLSDTYGEKVVLNGGLTITTSIDIARQTEAYESVYGPRPALQPGEPDAALVSVDEAGHIVALVGGRDYGKSQVNLALGREGGGGGRQAGSTFKAILLAAAVEEGYSLDSAFPAPGHLEVPGFEDGVDNYENESFSGGVNLVKATEHSVNTVYAELWQAIGNDKMFAEAKDLGITSPLKDVPSAFLGSLEVSPLEMTSAYSTFARGGVRRDPTIILKVKNREGETLEDGKGASNEVMSEDDAAAVTHALQSVVKSGTGVGARLDRPAAGKTGTTTDNTDAWFVGYTASPKLTTAVWMGYADAGGRKMDRVRGRAVTGGGLPASIWKAYMAKATAGAPKGEFPPLPDQGKKKSVPKATGRSSTKASTTLPDDGPTTTVDRSGSTTTDPDPTTSTRSGATTTSSTAPKPTTTTSRPSTTTSSPPTTRPPTTVTTRP